MMKSATAAEFNAVIDRDTFTESADHMLGGSRTDYYPVGAETIDDGHRDNRLACKIITDNRTFYYVNDPSHFVDI